MSDEKTSEQPAECTPKKLSLWGKLMKWNAEQKAKSRAKWEKSKQDLKKTWEDGKKDLRKSVQEVKDAAKEMKDVVGDAMKDMDPGLLLCPECGSEDLQVVTEVKSSGSSFGVGKGCCGYILFGPLGILCGACGKGKQVESETMFVCKGCGNKFKKLTKFDMMTKPAEWVERYHKFQEAARKRRGLEPEVKEAELVTEKPVEGGEPPAQNP